MRFERLTFSNTQGQQLSARLDWPIDGKPLAYALFAHCFTCTKNLKAVGHISNALTAEGIAVLRFDFTGLGESEGDFADTNFSSNVDDLVQAADFLRQEYGAPQLLIGHSLGGAAVLQAAHRIPECRAVATLGAPSDPGHVTHLLQCSLEEINQTGEARVLLAGRPFTIRKQFLDDLAENTMREKIATLRRPLMIFHSPLDTTVEIDNASKIFLAAKHPKSFTSLDKADHLLSRERDARYAGSILAAWAINHMELPEEEDLSLEGAQVLTRVEDGYRTEIRAGHHALLADEPTRLGGTDTGPNPYEYLLAALGACTTITMRMYANHKGLPLDAVNVRLSHRKVHAQDCQECESETGKVDIIDRELEIIGSDLTSEQRQSIAAIADKCPVHRTLHSEIRVRTMVKD